MNGHSSEEKLKILYEDSLRDIRQLADRMEATGKTVMDAAKLVAQGNSLLRAENEKLLIAAVSEVKASVEQVIGAQATINKSAANAAHALLTADGGPIKQVDYLVRQMRDALGWLDRATKFYEKYYVSRQILVALILGGISGALAGGIIGVILLRGHS